MKKLLLSISLLTIIISFQSCSKYPDNEGGSVFTKQFRLGASEWVSTEWIVTSRSNQVYKDDFTEFLNAEITFYKDGTYDANFVSDTRRLVGGSLVIDEINGERWAWRNNKSEIWFPDERGRETWEITRLDLLNLWVVATDNETDLITELKFESSN